MNALARHVRYPVTLRPLLAGIAFFALGLCGCGEDESPDPSPPDKDARVLIIGIDGLRGDGIPGADTPRFDALLGNAAWTLFASTQLGAPTVSGPGWTSILTGVDADKHGIYGNGGWENIERAYPTLVGRARDLGLSTATAIHWEPIHLDIIESEAADEATLGNDEEVTASMAAVLESGSHDLHFVHLDDIDHAGHSSGFSASNPDYQSAVEVVDELVGRMVDAVEARPSRADESWLIAITSDHGGAGTGHGGVSADHRAIPLIFAGDPVVPGEFPGTNEVPGELDDGFHSHLDIHPTIFQHLGFPPQTSWALDGVVRGLQ